MLNSGRMRAWEEARAAGVGKGRGKNSRNKDLRGSAAAKSIDTRAELTL